MSEQRQGQGQSRHRAVSCYGCDSANKVKILEYRVSKLFEGAAVGLLLNVCLSARTMIRTIIISTGARLSEGQLSSEGAGMAESHCSSSTKTGTNSLKPSATSLCLIDILSKNTETPAGHLSSSVRSLQIDPRFINHFIRDMPCSH